jgi:F420H(2)-dependent quinone reductase
MTGSDRETSTDRDLSGPARLALRLGDRKVRVRAQEVDSEERVRLWQKMIEMYPTYDDYQTKTKREIPLLLLRPVEGGGA